MADAETEYQQLVNVIHKVRTALLQLKKYKGNNHYKKLLSSSLSEFNHTYKFLNAKINKTNKKELKEKFDVVNKYASIILSNAGIIEKLETINDLEIFLPDLEIEFDNLKLLISGFEISEDIPMAEYRLDIEEAIKDFGSGCFISSLVLCRRAYEGALVELYRSKTNSDPIETIKCKHCNNIIREKSYIGIAKLHDWAIKSGFVTGRLRQVGFLLTDMGTGAAHPPLKEFPRDKEMSKLGIDATLALLKEICKKTG